MPAATARLLPAPAAVPADWPLRAFSHEVQAAGMRWHVQMAGRGPLLLLLHGTGASAHTWAGMLSALAEHATVLAPDLPGHGFTTGARPEDLTLPGMAQALDALRAALRLPPPQALIGHSAGAALALRWVLSAPPTGGAHAAALSPPATGDAAAAPAPDAAPMAPSAPVVLGFAPSLVAPPALYTQWLAPLINPLATSSAVAGLMARLSAGTGMVDGLLNSTGSLLTGAQRACYRRLFTEPAHVRGAVGFMAAADLPTLLAQCHAWPGDAAFVLGTRDTWVPERLLAPVIRRHLPRAQVQRWRAGHLVHEEQPQQAVDWVLQQLPWVRHDRSAPAHDGSLVGSDG